MAVFRSNEWLATIGRGWVEPFGFTGLRLFFVLTAFPAGLLAPNFFPVFGDFISDTIGRIIAAYFCGYLLIAIQVSVFQ
jgi:hypothetical protein